MAVGGLVHAVTGPRLHRVGGLLVPQPPDRDVAARGLEVAKNRDLLAHALEIIEGPGHLGRVGDGEPVQHHGGCEVAVQPGEGAGAHLQHEAPEAQEQK